MSVRSNDEGEPIAVIGLGCRFPGAPGPAAFWSLLERGGEAVGPLPAERQGASAGARVRGGFLADVDRFDARFFGISPREAERLDPQQRILLEVTWEALEDAGLVSERLDGSTAGVFVGMWINDYESRMFAETGRVDFHMTTGSGRYTASGRVSHLLGLRGPSVTIDTACSSSLVAAHLACQSLWSGESEIAIAAGVNVILQPHITAAYSQAGMLSTDGRCKFGDASADGYVRSEGAGVVVLKPLARARADRDPIRAVILGSAVNNDGHTGGSLGSPGRAGQEDLLRKAYRRAGVSPASVAYVEAHGTGTRAGDPVELGALGTVLGAGRPADRPCLVGSVKTNIGHTEGAAGIAGLIKVALSFEHGTIPASLHCETPTREVAWDEVRLGIARAGARWPAPGRAIAGVSSFGIGGTNAHVVLAAPEESSGETPAAAAAESGLETLLPLSARSAEGLREQAGRYAEYLGGGAPALADVAYTAALRRTHHEHRLAVVGRDAREIAQRLRAFVEAGSAVGAAHGTAGGQPRVAFVFPGQGSQWLGMGRSLLAAEPVFRAAIERCDRAIAALTGWSLLETLTDDRRAPERIDVIQPALFAIQVALAELWRAWGVEPTAVVGHSMGEVAAAHVAGALTLEDAARIICSRSRLLREISGQGAMAVVELSASEVRERLRGREDRLSIAVCNSERSTVVAGEVAALDALIESLAGDGVFCRRVKVDVASHSPQVEPLRAELLEALRGIRPTSTRIPMYSTVTGEAIDGSRLDAEYWMRNLRETVQFSAAVRRVQEGTADTFVEISPHPILLPAIEQSGPGGRAPLGLPSMRREESERAVMLESLGALYAHGQPIEWARLTRGACVALPAYPWQRERFWYPVAESGSRRAILPGAHPLLEEHLVSSADTGTHYWQGRLEAARAPWLLDHRVQGAAVLPASAMIELALHAGFTMFGDHRCRVEALRLETPLTVSEDRVSVLQLVVSENLPGAASFRLASRTVGDGVSEAWVVHATGSLRAAEPTAAEHRLAAAPTVEPASGTRHYEAMTRRGLQYGTAFQGITGVSRDGATVLTHLRVTDPVTDEDAGAYRIHPALLDACFQGAVAALDDKAPADVTYVPTGLERLTLHGPASGASLSCRVSPREAGSEADAVADIEMVDDAGRLVLEVEGFRLSPLLADAGHDLDRCLFDVEWTKAAAGASAGEATGVWVVLGDEAGATRQLADRLIARGGRCVAHIDDVRAGEAVRGVVDLRALDTVPLSRGMLEASSVAAAPAVRGLIDLVKVLAARDTGVRPRLLVVTAGVHVIAGDTGRVAVEQAPVWGVGAVIASEHPDLRCTRVDLSAEPTADEIEALGIECAAADGESEVALRGRDRYVARLSHVALAAADVERAAAAGETPFHVQVAAVPSIDGLRLRATPRRRPGRRQVEIEVRAVGLNFRDVMSVLGSLPGHPNGIGPIGMECSGRVAAVGEGVTGLAVGDDVVAIAFDSLGTHALADTRLVAPKSAALTHEVAATLPIAFVTAWLALHRLAGLGRGDRVLIHAASGGVGLAAVQIAQGAGATVFATAGSAAKREHLERLGVQHVFDSRSLAFAGEVMERTRGAGVDIVLNSLAGDAVAAGLSVLAPYGRFVEIGRRDIYRNSPMGLAPFRANLSYSALDLERMCLERPEVVGGLLREMLQRVEDGALDPLPVQVFPIAEVSEAFRFMAEARHIGKIALSLSAEETRQAPVLPAPASVRADGAYLITGGLGALGLAMAGALVDAGARHLMLLGRRPPGDGARRVIATLEGQGARVETVQADVADPDQLTQALAEARRGMPPLRGVIHAAGVLADATLTEMGPEEIRVVMAPKAAGAWALHTATESDPLDFFVMFSSAAALLGLAGQANYAAANAFLDALARHRRGLGRPALSIGWGPWAGAGLAGEQANRGERLAARGLRSLSPERGVAAFRRVASAGRAYVAVMALDSAAWCHAQAGPAPRLFARLLAPGVTGPGSAPTNDLLELLRAASPTERPVLLLSHLRGRVARILRLAASQVDADTPLKSMGLDSLMALELRNRLEADLGLRLSATLVWSHPTISALTTHFIEVLDLGAEGAAATVSREAGEPDPAAASISGLLDEELGRVSRLLAADSEGHGG